MKEKLLKNCYAMHYFAKDVSFLCVRLVVGGGQGLVPNLRLHCSH
jgi:hypothetical protein